MSSAKYQKALYGNQISLGMHFRMMFETEELGTRSCICSPYDSEITVLALLSYPDGERSTQQDGVILLFDAESPKSIASWSVKKNGLVYAIEFSHRSGRDLVNMAKKRSNVIPIIEDARHLASELRLTKWTLSGEVQELLPPAPLPPQNRGNEPRRTEEP